MLKSLLFLALPLSILSCPYDTCAPVDYGSCGNACCKLSVVVPGSTESVMNLLNATLNDLGPDGQYIPQMTAEGTLNFGDLRPYDKAIDFIGQAMHTTTNGMYTDTVNFNLSPTDDGNTEILAFSISQIAGAYGDDGQNYHNIVSLLTSVDYGEGKVGEGDFVRLDGSCPEPTEA